MTIQPITKELKIIDEDISYDIPVQGQRLISDRPALSRDLITFYQPNHKRSEQIRRLRNLIQFRWLDQNPVRKSIAILSPEAGEGRSDLAANLAVSFAQMGHKVLVVDTYLQKPRQHMLFGISNHSGLADLMTDPGQPPTVEAIHGLDNLHVLPAGFSQTPVHELINQPVFVNYLSSLDHLYDVIVLDTSPAKTSSDPISVAKRAGAVLQLARKDHTRMEALSAMNDGLACAHVQTLGTVLNEF